MTAQPPDKPDYSPETCCMCRWIVWNEDCGHPLSEDGIEDPHDRCELHGASKESVESRLVTA